LTPLKWRKHIHTFRLSPTERDFHIVGMFFLFRIHALSLLAIHASSCRRTRKHHMYGIPDQEVGSAVADMNFARNFNWCDVEDNHRSYCTPSWNQHIVRKLGCCIFKRK
jgi:hypothetical protein